MSKTLIAAITTITLALIFYTIGVWSEHRAKELKKSHVVFFWLGLIMDTTGTSLMSTLTEATTTSAGAISAHGITGVVAILLMVVHAIWATVVLVKQNNKLKNIFHKFSIAVWLIWLIPYIIGMVMGMM